MADGDRIRDLPGRYRSVLEQVFEGGSEPDELAYKMLKCLKHDLQKDGDAPFLALGNAVDLLLRTQRAAYMSLEVSWLSAYESVRDLVKESGINKTPMNRVINVCGSLLHQIECGVHMADMNRQMVDMYLENLYISRFESHVEAEAASHPTASLLPPMVIADRVAAIRPALQRGLAEFVSTLCSGKGVKALRMRPRKKPHVDFNRDLSLA